MRHRRASGFEINLSDFGLDYPLDFARQHARSLSTSQFGRLEYIDCAELSVEFKESIKCRSADAEFPRCISDLRLR